MWKFDKTIGFKIAAGYAALFFLSYVVLAIIAYLAVGSALARQEREKVSGEIESLSSQYESGGWKALHDTILENNRHRKNNPFFTRVLAAGDRPDLVFFPHHWEEFDLETLREMYNPRPGVWFRLPSRSRTFDLEIMTTRLFDGGLFQVGISTQDRLAVLGRLRGVFVTVSGALILLAVAGGALLSRRVLLPLRNLINTVSAIESGRMDARVCDTQTSDELAELGNLFNRMIEKINQLIRAMRGALDSVAHDLRTPMTRFRNNAEKALQADAPEAACREALQDCVEESDRILRMLGMLMDISEAETGAMRLVLKPVDLSPLAEAVVDMYRYVADEKGIRMETDFCDSAYIEADADRISQIMANLLDNAVKFTPENGVIRVGIEKIADTVMVRVSDSGIGILPEEIDRIWDRLYRGARSTHRGLGLGLSLVKAVLHAHHGEIRVSSTPGAGSVFEIRLPAIPPRQAHRPAS
jgi:signal transduction histidine kinase